MVANFVCYVCHASYHTNRHRCARECAVVGKDVVHRDFCQRCQKLVVANFEGQMVRRQLPSPRLRTE